MLIVPLSAQPQSEQNKYIASTSWTAAFCELAGLEDVSFIAPASLQHPPEYEITPADISNLLKADLFVYAGYERMMKQLEDVTEVPSIQIRTQNSRENVKAVVKKITDVTHTEELSAPLLKNYIDTVDKGIEMVKQKKLDQKTALVHKMQIPLAKDLGLNIVDTFGPQPMSAKQLADAAEKRYQIVIDNVHNPIADPIRELSPESKIIVWRNFPQTTGNEALKAMVKENIDALDSAF